MDEQVLVLVIENLSALVFNGEIQLGDKATCGFFEITASICFQTRLSDILKFLSTDKLKMLVKFAFEKYYLFLIIYNMFVYVEFIKLIQVLMLMTL